jgi:hypothetical protein
MERGGAGPGEILKNKEKEGELLGVGEDLERICFDRVRGRGGR